MSKTPTVPSINLKFKPLTSLKKMNDFLNRAATIIQDSKMNCYSSLEGSRNTSWRCYLSWTLEEESDFGREWGRESHSLKACVPDQMLQRLRWSLGCKLFVRDQHLWEEGQGSGILQRAMSVCHQTTQSLSPCCREPWGAYCPTQGSGVTAVVSPLGTPAQSLVCLRSWRAWPGVKSLRGSWRCIWLEAVCDHTP